MSFAEATKVTRVGSSSYRGEIHPGWDIFGVANGGYLMSMVARAIGEEAEGRALASINAHFTNPSRPGATMIEVERVKRGRSLSTFRVTMRSHEDDVMLVGTASYADPGRDVAPVEVVHSQPADVPPPEECVRAVPSNEAPLPPPFMSKVEVYLHPEDAEALLGQPTGVALVRGWFRLNEGEQHDPLATIVATDAFPPAVFNMNLPLTWTPTLDLTVHIRDPRPQEWMKCQFRTRFVNNGWLEEDGELWDREGKLIAQSRQLALVPR